MGWPEDDHGCLKHVTLLRWLLNINIDKFVLTVKKKYFFLSDLRHPFPKKWQAEWAPEVVCTLRIKEKSLLSLPGIEIQFIRCPTRNLVITPPYADKAIHKNTSLIRISSYWHITVSSFRHLGSRNSITNRYPLSSISQQVRHLLCHCGTKFIAWWQLQSLRLE
jgi:hypothetical protein